MYTEKQPQCGVGSLQTPVGEKPLLEQLSIRMERNNSEQDDILNLIENRLHSILNKREPTSEGCGKPNEGDRPADAARRFFENVFTSECNTDRLRRILSHLESIV
jgi:hypothetical protein